MTQLAPLNILHLAASIGRNSGGIGPTLVELTREQRRLGHSPSIWSLDPPMEARWVEQDAAIGKDSIQTFQIIGPRQIGFSPSMQRAILSARGRSFDILHQHSIWTACSQMTAQWHQAHQRPTVLALGGTLEPYALRRSTWKKNLARLAYEWRNLTSASCLYATSDMEVHSIRNYGLVNPIAVIPLGIPERWMNDSRDSLDFRTKYDIPVAQYLFLFLSRIHPKKGLPLLLKALASLNDCPNDWTLVVAGTEEGDHLRAVKSLAKELHIENRIQFIGELSSDEKRNAFAAADVFVLPTYSENFAIVVPEALGAGVPVLTTRGTPWSELETVKCGWWVDVSVEGIRNGLLAALRLSKNELNDMGKRGKALVARKYTWAKTAEKTILLYNWLLGVGERPDFVIVD